jgi:hypothetical protein
LLYLRVFDLIDIHSNKFGSSGICRASACLLLCVVSVHHGPFIAARDCACFVEYKYPIVRFNPNAFLVKAVGAGTSFIINRGGEPLSFGSFKF